MHDVLDADPETSVPLRGPLPCQTADPDLFFAEAPARLEQAKALCAPCPLREACLAGALERAEPYGVWGGQIVLDGVVVARKRPRGRPRKDDVTAPSFQRRLAEATARPAQPAARPEVAVAVA